MSSTTPKGTTYGFADHEDGWGAAMNANLRLLDSMALSAFAYDPANTSGLNLRIKGGPIQTGAVWSFIADASVALTDNATNYVERTRAGVLSANTTGFSATKIPVATAVTSSGTITTVTDYRQALSAAEIVGDPMQLPCASPSTYNDYFPTDGALSGWTAYNNGSNFATGTVSGRRVVITGGTSGYISGWEKTLAGGEGSGAWRLRCRVRHIISQDNGGFGLIVRNAANNKGYRMFTRTYGNGAWGTGIGYGRFGGTTPYLPDADALLFGGQEIRDVWFMLIKFGDGTVNYCVSDDKSFFRLGSYGAGTIVSELGGHIDRIGFGTMGAGGGNAPYNPGVGGNISHFEFSTTAHGDDLNAAW